MAWIGGLRTRMRLSAAFSLLLALLALAVATGAAADARQAAREMSERLLPAATEAVTLSEAFLAEQTSLRDYVTSGGAQALQTYREAAAHVPGILRRLSDLVASYPGVPERLRRLEADREDWLRLGADPQMSAMAAGDRARARANQDSGVARPSVVAMHTDVAALQAWVTAEQSASTGRLYQALGALVNLLIATVALVVLRLVWVSVRVRRTLLQPFVTLRRAADAVAAGRYETPVPAVGPTELADLGRSVETMRSRLVGALTQREAAEEYTRAVVASASDAFVSIDEYGVVIDWNGAGEALFGWTAEEALGRVLADLIIPAESRQAHIDGLKRVLDGGESKLLGRRIELTALHRDGHPIQVELSIWRSSAGPHPRFHAFLHDISERLALQAERERLKVQAEREQGERRLHQAQRLESLGQLAGGVAHDFNNLLAVIVNYLGFVAGDLDEAAADDPERWQGTRADIDQVQLAADRATRLTRQLLAFGRRDIAKPEVLDLQHVVADMEQLLHRTLGEHIELQVGLSPQLWRVVADLGQIEQVLVNLAVNARDAMLDGGMLIIDIDNLTADEGYAATHPTCEPGDYVRIRVSDTGSGMPKDVIDRAFEPFYTTKPKGKGTGLGLATVYGIITQAGGHVQIYSEVGHGTAITLLLPATERPVSARGSRDRCPARVPGSGQTVLLVEDETALREVAYRILSRNGYHVIAAGDGPEALALAERHDGRIHLLLTDVVMPHMLGKELAHRISRQRPDTRVLYVSGYAHPVLASQGTLEPDVALLEKPFTETALLTQVSQALAAAT